MISKSYMVKKVILLSCTGGDPGILDRGFTFTKGVRFVNFI